MLNEMLHAHLKADEVMDLGRALINASDTDPLLHRTERDFVSLVVTYFRGRMPETKIEYVAKDGEVDFRVGWFNPSILELAVAPRKLQEPGRPTQRFRGHGSATQLYAGQNKSEIKKLASFPKNAARGRYLLLVDFCGPVSREKLQSSYEKVLPKDQGYPPVTVVYVHREPTACFKFSIGGKKKGPKPKH